MYKRNLREEKYVENISNPARTELHRMRLEGRSAIPWPAEETGLAITAAKTLLLRKSPIAGPQFQSALNASCRYLQVLGSPTCPCKFLKTLVIHTLKRLASAVQLRPWPPYFQYVTQLALPFLVPISPKTYCTLLLRLLNRSTTLFCDSGTNCM
jgi:hypothetical protein